MVTKHVRMDIDLRVILFICPHRIDLRCFDPLNRKKLDLRCRIRSRASLYFSAFTVIHEDELPSPHQFISKQLLTCKRLLAKLSPERDSLLELQNPSSRVKLFHGDRSGRGHDGIQFTLGHVSERGVALSQACRLTYEVRGDW